jgi:hypothetical protein
LCFVFLFHIFSEVFHILSHFLFNTVDFHPEFIYLSIYGVLCFTFVFIQGFYGFFYLFLCFVIFFIFIVLEFLVSCTFWLIISSIKSMKFSLITCMISSFRLFLWALLGSLA